MPPDSEPTFPLTVIGNQLENWQPPTSPFDALSDWDHRYQVITVGQQSSARVGRVRLRRLDRGARFQFEYEAGRAGRVVQGQTAEIRCATDRLCTPQRWDFASWTPGDDGQPLAVTKLEKTGEVTTKAIRLSDAASRRDLPRPAAFTLNWLLFDVVQRLPRQSTAPLQFTLLDDFDEPKPEVTLAFWRTWTVTVGGRRVQQQTWEELPQGRIRKTTWARVGQQRLELVAYSLLGPGLVPCVYCVDPTGRMVLAAAGLEAYLLDTTEEAA